MKHSSICFLVFVILLGCKSNRTDSTITTYQVDSIKMDNIQSSAWTSLDKYIGTYPKSTDFFENPVVINELKRILSADYKAYTDHVSIAGCGMMTNKDNLIIGDVSQLHVGGYSSLIMLDKQQEKMYLFWLTGSVKDKSYKIYGDMPIPKNIVNVIADNMNKTWGHVAKFTVNNDNIKIELK